MKNVYTKSEAKKEKIEYVSWKQLNGGDGLYILTDNDFVVNVKILNARFRDIVEGRSLEFTEPLHYDTKKNTLNFNERYKYLPDFQISTIELYEKLIKNKKYIRFLKRYAQFYMRTHKHWNSIQLAFYQVYEGYRKDIAIHSMKRNSALIKKAVFILLSNPYISRLYMKYMEELFSKAQFDPSKVINGVMAIGENKEHPRQYDALIYLMDTLKEVSNAREERERPQMGGLFGQHNGYAGLMPHTDNDNGSNGNNHRVPEDPEKAIAFLNDEEDNDSEL